MKPILTHCNEESCVFCHEGICCIELVDDLILDLGDFELCETVVCPE